jgi:hypothetical protein
LLALAVAAVSVAVPTASGTRQATVKPVIGKPVITPARAEAGKKLTVVFKVTRSDTGKALTVGRMICDPSVGGKVIPHTESFRGGFARLSLVVPAAAQGKLLTVKLDHRGRRSVGDACRQLPGSHAAEAFRVHWRHIGSRRERGHNDLPVLGWALGREPADGLGRLHDR